jgi:hypothetical protein
MSMMQIEIRDQKKKTHNESQPEVQSARRVYRFGMEEEEKLGGQPRNVFHVGVLRFIEGDSDLKQNISGRKGSEVKVAAPSS